MALVIEQLTTPSWFTDGAASPGYGVAQKPFVLKSSPENPIFGLAIGPGSHTDKVYLKKIDAGAARVYRVSVGCPWIGPVEPGDYQVLPGYTVPNTGTRFFAQSSYTPLDSAYANFFTPTEKPVNLYHRMTLVVYRGEIPPLMPMRRAPFEDHVKFTPANISPNYQFLRVFPTFGRRFFQVVFENSNVAVSYRVYSHFLNSLTLDEDAQYDTYSVSNNGGMQDVLVASGTLSTTTTWASSDSSGSGLGGFTRTLSTGFEFDYPGHFMSIHYTAAGAGAGAVALKVRAVDA